MPELNLASFQVQDLVSFGDEFVIGVEGKEFGELLFCYELVQELGSLSKASHHGSGTDESSFCLGHDGHAHELRVNSAAVFKLGVVMKPLPELSARDFGRGGVQE